MEPGVVEEITENNIATVCVPNQMIARNLSERRLSFSRGRNHALLPVNRQPQGADPHDLTKLRLLLGF